ncbi:hypothetical protein [Pseudonocardia sp. H11422]|uniref:hypothetical protein n=1 Tax=Pseudonocardia sp. H11422 TaxID=2835866 RepID=UPI001BDC6C91|nr:hypothetical protein [Pseudonocardia sp. H11422]
MPPIPWRRRGVVEPEQDYLVMASRLPLRTFLRIPWFLLLTAHVVRQLERTDGLVGYSLLARPAKRTFCTLSAWAAQRDLDAYVAALPHVAVMSRLRPHMQPTTFTTWTARGSALPVAWPDALAHLAEAETRPGTGAP